MSCEKIEERLLDDDQAFLDREVREHLKCCPACSKLYDELEEIEELHRALARREKAPLDFTGQVIAQIPTGFRRKFPLIAAGLILDGCSRNGRDRKLPRSSVHRLRRKSDRTGFDSNNLPDVQSGAAGRVRPELPQSTAIRDRSPGDLATRKQLPYRDNACGSGTDGLLEVRQSLSPLPGTCLQKNAGEL